MKPNTALLLLFSLLTSFLSLHAQDTIVLNDWHMMRAKDLKVGEIKTEFKRPWSKKGRVLTLHNRYIFAIKYQNGSIAQPNGREISRREFEYLKLKDISKSKLKDGIAMAVIGSVVVAGGASLIGFGIQHEKKANGDALFGVLGYMLGGVSVAAAIPLVVLGGIKVKRSKKALRTAEAMKPL
jgi:hypothetical protein